MIHTLKLLLLLMCVNLCAGQLKLPPRKNVQLPKPNFGDTSWTYSIRLNENNHVYFLSIDVALSTGNTISDGELNDYSPSQLFFGYDTSIVRLRGDHLVPKSIGHTAVFLRDPNDSTVIADSISISIIKRNGNLMILDSHK